MKIAQRILGLLCHGTIYNLTILIYPALRARMKPVKHRLYRITGAGTSDKICVAHQSHRIFTLFCSHPVFHKCFDNFKGIVQRLRFVKPKFIHPVFSKPQKSRTMIDHSFRDCHQLSVELPRIHKVTAITLEHLLDSCRCTAFIDIRQVFYKIIFYQFFKCLSVRNNKYIRQCLVFYQNIDKLIITVFPFHICIVVLDIQHLPKISRIDIIFVGVSIREV